MYVRWNSWVEPRWDNILIKFEECKHVNGEFFKTAIIFVIGNPK